MPTYQNDGGSGHMVRNIYGRHVWVEPGESVKSYGVLPDFFTQTDAAPIRSSVVCQQNDVAGADDVQTVQINEDTKHVFLRSITDGVTADIYYEATTNGEPVISAYDGSVVKLSIERWQVKQLAIDFTGTGTLAVEQHRR